MKKIIIIGKSEKFTKIIKKLYCNYKIDIFPWRKINNTQIMIQKKK